jgi:Werner syndrome ATP-dependent helicase
MDSYEKSKLDSKRYKKVKKVLKKKFGHNSFRPHQYEIINSILNAKDVTAVLPTGYGKSICFQLPAMYSKEPAIVISPLIALMDDQRMLLEEKGIKSCCWNSTVSNKKQLEKEILNGDYSIIYITPESVIKCGDLLDSLYASHGISVFAIDEAHCISSYGFEFRESYRELHRLRNICDGVPILAVTATATEEVIRDINKVMTMKGKTIKTSFNRPNLHLTVKQRSKKSIKDIMDIVTDTDGSSIIYCVTKKDTEMLYSKMLDDKIKCGMYHAGLKTKERQETQEKFIKNKIKIIVATIAFGMGINKSDVRNVIHFGCPKNLESYYQEIGRGGRDGKDANCYLYYSTKDFIIQQRFINDITDDAYRLTRKRLLDVMIKFVNTSDCRKKVILDYFGDNSIKKQCNKCDNCDTMNRKAKGGKDDKDAKLEKTYGDDMYRMLSVVHDVNANFGSTVIVGILRGSKSKKIPTRYHKNTHYGIGKRFPDKWWKELLDELIDHGYVESYQVAQLIYVPRITEKGMNYLKEYLKNELDIPDDIKLF